MKVKNMVVAAVVAVSAFSFAGDKGPSTAAAASKEAKFRPGAEDGPGGPGGPGGPFGPEGRERRERQGRMMMVLGISEALELSDVDALKLSDKIKAFEDRRKPIHEAMFESMKSLKAAAEGDATAAAQVDANVQKILDGRTQMAALDKDVYNQLAAGLSPQKRAKLALVLGHLHREMQRGGGGGEFKGHGGGF